MTTTVWSPAELNDRADAQAARLSWLSVHTDPPGDTGASEAGGGSPAYARQALTFSPAGTEGPLGAALQPATVGTAWSDLATFDLPAGEYTDIGAWSTPTGGTFRGGRPMSTLTLTAQGVLSLAVGVTCEGI